MENGGDVKGVFTRFCQLSNAIKEAAEANGKKLMEHPNLGHAAPLSLRTLTAWNVSWGNANGVPY